jgi:hypothetical protein
MKTQVFVSDKRGAQHAIDQVKKAYATGEPHLVLIQEPSPQTTSKQKTKAMTLCSIIARETGEEDVRRIKWWAINGSGWFAEKVEEMSPMEVGLTDLDRDQANQLIDRLEQFMAENGIADEG